MAGVVGVVLCAGGSFTQPWHSTSRASPLLSSLSGVGRLSGASKHLMNDLLGLRGSGDHGPLPILTYLCLHPAQAHGSRLRIPQVFSTDSGEYVCRVETGAGSKEASITVSVLYSPHSGPSYTPGVEPGGPGQRPGVSWEGACGLFRI